MNALVQLTDVTKRYDSDAAPAVDQVSIAIAQGEELGMPMSVCQAARLTFKHAMFAGAANDDLSTLIRHVEQATGLEMPKTR